MLSWRRRFLFIAAAGAGCQLFCGVICRSGMVFCAVLAVVISRCCIGWISIADLG
jgi:hypothetical protein